MPDPDPLGDRHRSAWAVGVVVPARDEAGSIEACLRSIRASLAAAPIATTAVAVVADRCLDDTALRAAAALGPEGHVLTSAAANVGRARGLGVDHVLARLLAQGARPERTWLCTTDADSTVPIDWVVGHLHHAAAGAAAVAGLVEVDSFEHLPGGVGDRFRSDYDAGISPLGSGHRHVHGANLGVRADAYLAVGGWSGLVTAEDHDLWERLRAGSWPVVAATGFRVTTSGRAIGRAPAGFADLLSSLEATP